MGGRMCGKENEDIKGGVLSLQWWVHVQRFIVFIELLEVVRVKVILAVWNLRDIFPCISEDLTWRDFAEMTLKECRRGITEIAVLFSVVW